MATNKPQNDPRRTATRDDQHNAKSAEDKARDDKAAKTPGKGSGATDTRDASTRDAAREAKPRKDAGDPKNTDSLRRPGVDSSSPNGTGHPDMSDDERDDDGEQNSGAAPSTHSNRPKDTNPKDTKESNRGTRKP